MANLILLKSKGETINMNEIAVHPEEQIERILFETKNILPDVCLLKRQLQTYTQKDRIDIVGLDNDNNILVIEIKAHMVNEDVIPQVLRYAGWVEIHPDAIKSIWLEQKDKLDDIDFNWEKPFDLKVLIIGPSFNPSVQKLIKRITYPVDLIEFKKFNDGTHDYFFLNKLMIEDEKPATPISTITEHDEEFYKKRYSAVAAQDFWLLCNHIEDYIKAKGWNLTRSNNKGYISFKYGFPIAFGVTFTSVKTFALFFKISKKAATSIKIAGHEMLRYEDQWKQALYNVESGSINLKIFDPLFEEAYKNIVGKK